MSGYVELRELGVRFVPPDGPMPPSGGRYPLFRATWATTVKTLAAELGHLGAEGIAIELDMEERMFRLDGIPRSDARARSDAVRISFTSRWGPLRYETNEFIGRWGEPGWQQNLRAIALSMEALRAVDRYGVSKRGEQYRGWRAIAMSSEEDSSMMSAVHARQFLEPWGGDWKRAAKETHPDQGGDEATFRKVMRAKELIGG